MLLRYPKISSKTKPCWWWCSRQNQYISGFKVNKTFWISFYTTKHYFSTLLPVLLWLFIKNGSHGWRASCIWTVNFKRLQEFDSINGALSSLKTVLATGSPLKMMKNAFYFILKPLLVLKIFTFLSWIFGHVKKGLD